MNDVQTTQSVVIYRSVAEQRFDEVMWQDGGAAFMFAIMTAAVAGILTIALLNFISSNGVAWGRKIAQSWTYISLSAGFVVSLIVLILMIRPIL